MKPLYGHVSEETAYHIADYPYGFKLRCEMKVWLEYREGKGYRMVTRTSNPKRPGTWNKEKASTYRTVAGNLYLDENDHIHWSGLMGWESNQVMEQFLQDFPETDSKATGLIKALINRQLKKPIL
jgi:hypothetical protein